MTIEKIKNLEALTKLNLPENERETALKHISYFDEQFKLLDDVNTDGVEPLVSVSTLKNVLRDDVSYKMVTREEVLSNAPEQVDGYFQVPKTIE